MIAAPGHLAATRSLVERTIGRPLRQAELVIDVFGLTRELDRAKAELVAAIDAEKTRRVRAAVRTGHPLRFDVTRAMLVPLERLWRHGRDDARRELAELGYPLRRRLEAEPKIPQLAEIAARLKSGLTGFAVRITNQRVELEAGGRGMVGDALARALLAQPGGRSIAAGLVSPTLFGGMAVTFEEHADLIPCWEYSSVLDGGTCDACAPMDGTEYHSLDELFADLPNFGPYVNCLGGDRCRCRAVPCGPDG
jgi:hypothetical protein